MKLQELKDKFVADKGREPNIEEFFDLIKKSEMRNLSYTGLLKEFYDTQDFAKIIYDDNPFLKMIKYQNKT